MSMFRKTLMVAVASIALAGTAQAANVVGTYDHGTGTINPASSYGAVGSTVTADPNTTGLYTGAKNGTNNAAETSLNSSTNGRAAFNGTATARTDSSEYSNMAPATGYSNNGSYANATVVSPAMDANGNAVVVAQPAYVTPVAPAVGPDGRPVPPMHPHHDGMHHLHGDAPHHDKMHEDGMRPGSRDQSTHYGTSGRTPDVTVSKKGKIDIRSTGSLGGNCRYGKVSGSADCDM